jgi:hypothetical protein
MLNDDNNSDDESCVVLLALGEGGAMLTGLTKMTWGGVGSNTAEISAFSC